MGMTAGSRAIPVTFRFSNIGPIQQADLALGDLTVIAGRNNTGKTYVAYSLYGFLKWWGGWRRAAERLVQDESGFPQVRALDRSIRGEEEERVPLSTIDLARQRSVLAQEVAAGFSPMFGGVFNSRHNSFAKSALEIIGDDGSLSQGPSPFEFSLGRRPLTIHYHDGAVTASGTSGRGAPRVFTLKMIAHAYYEFLMQDLFPNPFVLTAERFGISLFFKELDFTKNQIIDLLQKHVGEGTGQTRSPFLIVDQTTSRYARPIKDNIDFTRSIPDLPSDRSPLADENLFDNIKEMMQGYYSNARDDIRFIAKARKHRHFNIPLHLASSSARGLSDLYFFLKYSASRDRLLIIDEPESHLDTANQVQFARLLARFVTAGLRVVITTHSDYILKELNNLIMLSRNFPDKTEVAKKLRYGPDEGLGRERVRAYVAENGGLTECKIGPYGIEMPVFDDTIDAINDRAIALASRMESEAGE